ncbi:CS domain-containing protein [Phlyctema vagabunda]|uniref:CS domain-containing protein n=1 Tax=Phlyctema vagabunda TaxID=108571 RepID=A0ABR4PID1_9HELO
MSSHAALGQVALDKRDYDEAIKQYTKALLTNTSNPSPLWLIQRSTAYQRFGKHELALADAECAIHAALDRGRRELIATAQFRRAIALNCLQRYGDSRICFTWCRKLNEKEKGLGMWQGKVAKDYEKAEQSVGKDAKETKITVKEIPGRIDFAKSEASRAEAESSKSSNSSAEVTTTSSEKISAGGEANEKGKRKVIVKANSKNENAAIMPMESGRTSLDKIRHDWYQSTEKVTIDLLVKGVPPQPVTEVLIRKDSVKVSYPTTDDKENNLWLEVSFEDLDGEVDPESSTFKIMKTKIEITLKKSVPGIKWKRLGNFMKEYVHLFQNIPTKTG